MSSHAPPGANTAGPHGWFAIPLFIRIAIGLVVGLILGLILRPAWHGNQTVHVVRVLAGGLDEVAKLVLRFLGAVAMPLILLAVVRSLMATDVRGIGKLIYLLMLNTTVAILVGLTVANVVRPGTHTKPPPDAPGAVKKTIDPLGDFLASLPDSLLKPVVENNSIGVIVLALTFGTAARRLPGDAKAVTLNAVSIGFDLVVIVLHWILELVPLAVACRVAFLLTTGGVEPFISLGWFVMSVMAALVLQGGYYLLRVWWNSWVTPMGLIAGSRDALVMAFSTGSSVATMPLTYECMTDRVGLRPASASLGVLVGGNFNHDGTALYEAMSALFVAQAIGMHLSIGHQVVVVLTSMIAAVGAAGIPEAGLVTMTLVFSAVNLPVGLVAMLLPVDWFLDRCRTAINVMGDTSVACLLDGMRQVEQGAAPPDGPPSATAN